MLQRKTAENIFVRHHASANGDRPVSQQLSEHRKLAHELLQPTASCMKIFHKYCCYTKCGGITTNLTPRIIGSMLLMCQNATMRVYGAWIKTYHVLCSKTYSSNRLNLGWSLQWRHNEGDDVSIRQPHDCLLNRLFRRGSKKTSKLRVTGLCAGNSPVTGEFPAQMTSNAEDASIWWRHHGLLTVLWRHRTVYNLSCWYCPGFFVQCFQNWNNTSFNKFLPI